MHLLCNPQGTSPCFGGLSQPSCMCRMWLRDILGLVRLSFISGEISGQAITLARWFAPKEGLKSSTHPHVVSAHSANDLADDELSFACCNRHPKLQHL